MQLSQPNIALLQEAAHLCERSIPTPIQGTAPQELTTTFHQALMELIEGRLDSDEIKSLLRSTQVAIPIAFEKYLLATDSPLDSLENLAIVTMTTQDELPILAFISHNPDYIEIPNVSESLFMERALKNPNIDCERGSTIDCDEHGFRINPGTFKINTTGLTTAIYDGLLTATYDPHHKTIDLIPTNTPNPKPKMSDDSTLFDKARKRTTPSSFPLDL